MPVNHSAGPPIFGFHPSYDTTEQVVDRILSRSGEGPDTVKLVVTPNIDHVTQLRHNAALREAYTNAEIIVCDGFPV
jgi:N-acetylglucosaminyldiphosphoundecaprenol N-acetyl-beta-D-mannosaminyltransferase